MDFSQYINDGLLYAIKYGRGDVIVAYEQNNPSISVLVQGIHGTAGSTGLTSVSRLEFIDDLIKLKVVYEDCCTETGGIKNILVKS